MRAFVTVAETGSFTSAAARLGMSRAMASKHVMDLEAHLGLRLLNRTTRSVSLTEAGASYAARCRDIIEAIEAAEREVTSHAVEPVGRLRVTAPVFFGAKYIAPLVETYARQFPGLGLDLVLNDRYVDLVEEGYDLAVRIGRLDDSSLIARRIAPTRTILCGAPSYLDRRGRPLLPADLAGYDCLQYSYAVCGSAWTFQGPRGREVVRVSSRIACNNGEALCRMAVEGLGLVYEPDFILAPYLRSRELEQILTDYMPEPAGVFVVHPSRRHVPLKVKSCIEFLSAAFAERLPWAV